MSSIVFHVRMSEEDRDAFHARAKELNLGPSEFAREVLKAAADGRINITPSADQIKQQSELYNGNS